MRIDTHAHTAIDVRMDVHVDRSISMHTASSVYAAQRLCKDMRTDTCIDMHLGMRLGMRLDTCV